MNADYAAHAAIYIIDEFIANTQHLRGQPVNHFNRALMAGCAMPAILKLQALGYSMATIERMLRHAFYH